MKQVNFSHSGGFPLEQETLERLQTAYRSELFAALQSHLSIEKDTNYIVAYATEEKTGWVIIHQNEKDAVGDPAGILYPIQKANKTDFLKTTRTGTNLTYGDGTSQTAYFDYDAVYIDESEFNTGVAENSDASTINYYDLSTFTVVKDIQSIKNSIETIEADIDLINQTYLPINGSKAMQGDLDLGIHQLSKLDIKESSVANVRAADFRLGSIGKRGLLHSDPLGRALVDDSNETSTSLSVNHQSDWDNTHIGGKVYLKNLNTSNSTGSLLVIDDSNQVTKSNSLPDLLDRITVLENKIATTTAVPLGMIAIWGKPAPFPEGWEEYVPLRGRMPVGFDSNQSEFNNWNVTDGGNKSKILTKENIPQLDVTLPISESENSGGDSQYVNATDLEGVGTKKYLNAANNGNTATAINILNPYRVVHFIEYTGRPSDQTVPTSPTDLTVSNIATTSVTLNWTASTDNVGVSNYVIYKNGTFFDTVAGSVLSYVVTGLTAATSYSFYVVAKDAAGNSSTASNAVNATTNIADTIAPSTPTGLRCYPTSENHITIEWNPSTDNVAVDRYLVFRRIEGGSSEVYFGTPDNFGTVLGTPGINYYFKVKALDAAGNESPFTSEVIGFADSSVGDPGDEDPENSCFDVESLVTMASGQSKKLKNIVIGDKLQGFSFPNEIDESDGDYMIWNGKLNEAVKAEVTVVNKITSVQPNYYEIKTADTTIKVTGQHPLLVTEDGENVQWVCTKNVVQSMLLIDKTGSTKAIESIVFKEEPLEVALLDVENVDNYVISGIVAHNSKPQDPHDPQP